MTDWHDIGPSDDFQEEAAWPVQVAGRSIAIFRLGGEVFALDDRCTHGQARLSEGFIEDGCIECPLHQGRFDIRSGQPQCPPVTQRVPTYATREHASRVWVQVVS